MRMRTRDLRIPLPTLPSPSTPTPPLFSWYPWSLGSSSSWATVYVLIRFLRSSEMCSLCEIFIAVNPRKEEKLLDGTWGMVLSSQLSFWSFIRICKAPEKALELVQVKKRRIKNGKVLLVPDSHNRISGFLVPSVEGIKKEHNRPLITSCPLWECRWKEVLELSQETLHQMAGLL